MNCDHWLVVNKEDIIGESGEKFYSNKLVRIVGSSVSGESYTARWYRRKGVLEDPWVSLRDHNDPAKVMLYGGKSSGGHVDTLMNNGGSNVFIRKFGM